MSVSLRQSSIFYIHLSGLDCDTVYHVCLRVCSNSRLKPPYSYTHKNNKTLSEIFMLKALRLFD